MKKTRTLIQKDICTPTFIAALFINTITKTWKQPKCPSTDEWIKKIYIYIYTMEYYSAIKKNEILPSETTCKSDRKRKILYDLTDMWNLKIKTSEIES